MARLVRAACPNCGAGLALDPKNDWVTCNYCGKSALIQRPRRDQPAPPVQPHGQPTIVLPQQRSSPVALVIVGLAVVLLIGGGAAAWFVRSGGGGGGTPVLLGHPMSADVDGDGSAELIVEGVRVGGTNHHFYAYRPHSGDKLWESDAIESSVHPAAIAANRLLAVEGGKLHGFDLATGKRAFSRDLHEAGSHFCEHGGKTTLVTKDHVMHAVDPATGQLSALGNVARGRSPGLSCISVSSVQGSAGFIERDVWNDYRDKVPGMYVSSASQIGESADVLLLGYRTPGSRVPMIALDSGGTIKWSSPVPASDPLRAKEGDPESHAVESGRIVVVHAFARSDETRVTCFEQRSGRRLWETKLGKISWYRLELTERYVLLGSSPNVHVLSLADGKLLRVIGLQR